MTVDDLTAHAKKHVSNMTSFNVDQAIFLTPDGSKEFNKTIRTNVSSESGVYIISNKENTVIFYIGMAGRLRKDGLKKNHTLQKRLTASRGRDALTKKDILTNDWIRNFLFEHKIQSLNFHILYTKTEEPAAYVEALLMYRYYKHFKQIPMLNSEF
jgi:hypothetical protein